MRDGPSKHEEYFQRVVTLAEQIAKPDPKHVGARRGLIEAYLQLGRAHGFNHEREAAADWFLKMNGLAERWVADEPDNTLARDLLSSSYRKLADEPQTRQRLRGGLAAAISGPSP